MTTTADRYISQPDRLLGRTFDVFGGGAVQVLEHWPERETGPEQLAMRVLDTGELVRLDARTWRDLEVAGAIYEC